jgi:hypothetical protein
MMVDLADAVDMLESWNTGKGLIIYGYGHTFCSGGDFNTARMFSNPDDGFLMAVFMQRVLGQLEKLPLISVALIGGIGKPLSDIIVYHQTLILLLHAISKANETEGRNVEFGC